jgi:NTP pyrophosphatase (non-canonical NTP hydrolase)
LWQLFWAIFSTFLLKKEFSIIVKSVGNIHEFQELMKELYLEKDLKRGKEKTALKLMEEVGELAEAVLLDDEEKVSEEMADIIAWVFSIANLYNINLSDAFNDKYNKTCPKCNENPCVCNSI